MARKALWYVLTAMILLALATSTVAWVYLNASLPDLTGRAELPGLESPVTVAFDRFGIPTITAENRADAYRALGYLTARDRLFQMDLIRRKAAGRLAEVFGEAALELDREQRIRGFAEAARAVVTHVPESQRAILRAYAEGVNAWLRELATLPFEFLLAGYRPDPWEPADSLLAVFAMFQILADTEQEERMLTVMAKTLPQEVVAFLTPDTDDYATVLLGGAESRRPVTPIPAAALARLRRSVPAPETPLAGADADAFLGSNAWAVSGARTVDGRAILANDMHLRLEAPNIWYRARLRYGHADLNGVTLPGIPLLVAGSNGQLAWGFTNVYADQLDLVLLATDPANPDRYQTPDGWEPFGIRREIIRVRDREDVVLEVKVTRWGPVAQTPLLGQPVAIQWAALDPAGVDLGFLAMAEARTLEEGIRAMNRTAGPPQNVLLADAGGRIAWTYLGKLPVRRGFDGTAARSWADGQTGWEGYIPPDELPRVVDPPEGLLVSANNRSVGKEYPYVIGHNFAHGYRAYRIQERLRAMGAGVTEQAMLELQLDTVSHFYDFYRQLTLALLSDPVIATDPLLAEARDAIRAWDGQAAVDSVGLGVLAAFRGTLMDAVFAPFLGECRAADKDFAYRWWGKETPLRRLLTARIPETLPDPIQYPDWNAFLLGKLKESAAALQARFQGQPLSRLTWGEVNSARIAHPFSRMGPVLAGLLDLPGDRLAGCPHCVRVVYNGHGASQRMVVAPGKPEDAILHMPGGQSGHPLSPHYADQHPYWREGKPLPLLPGPAAHTLHLEPGL